MSKEYVAIEKKGNVLYCRRGYWDFYDASYAVINNPDYNTVCGSYKQLPNCLVSLDCERRARKYPLLGKISDVVVTKK
jgi:hypothetical protein